MRRQRILATTMAVALSLIGTAAVGNAATPTADQVAIAAIIKQFGGTQTSPTTISWDSGRITLELRDELDATPAGAVNGCSAGAFCAFEDPIYGGAKLTFTACPTNVTALLGITSVGSMQNNRTSGTVKAYASSTLRATLAPGAGIPSLAAGINKISCV